MRLVNNKVTLVHRRLWPALLRLEDRFGATALLVVTQEHTPSGAHRATSSPLHDWVSSEVLDAAARLSEAEAIEHAPADPATSGVPRSRRRLSARSTNPRKSTRGSSGGRPF